MKLYFQSVVRTTAVFTLEPPLVPRCGEKVCGLALNLLKIFQAVSGCCSHALRAVPCGGIETLMHFSQFPNLQPVKLSFISNLQGIWTDVGGKAEILTGIVAEMQGNVFNLESHLDPPRYKPEPPYLTRVNQLPRAESDCAYCSPSSNAAQSRQFVCCFATKLGSSQTFIYSECDLVNTNVQREFAIGIGCKW